MITETKLGRESANIFLLKIYLHCKLRILKTSFTVLSLMLNCTATVAMLLKVSML